jgi:RHS repeat-associated protein
MKLQQYIAFIAIFLVTLIVSISFVSAAEIKLTYDANGNLITGDGKFRVYNGFNQLSKINNGTNSSGYLIQEYVYDPTEERVLYKKTYNTAGSWVETVYYINQNFVQVKNLSGSFNFTYVYQDGQMIAQKLADGTKQYIHSDAKTSNTVITNSAGQSIENTSYSPYGEVLTGGQKNRYNYESKENDGTASETDFNFRKYRADLGIFTQPDSQINNFYDPQELNRYSFERNNPYKNIDPTGHAYTANAGDAAEDINRYLAMFLIFPTARNEQTEQRQYEQLYKDWCSTYICEKSSQSDNPSDPYEYDVQGNKIRRLNLESLKSWDAQRYKGLQISSTNPTQKAPDINIFSKKLTNPIIITEGKSRTVIFYPSRSSSSCTGSCGYSYTVTRGDGTKVKRTNTNTGFRDDPI